ncbi:MAG: hypothetical protein AAGA58_13920 [Verrucomicrobiota bacterium]
MSEGTSPPTNLHDSDDKGSVWDALQEWEGWTEWSPWIWIAGALLGYGLLLRQQPMRDCFGEGWALLLDRGNGWVLGSVATVAMLVTTGNWWCGNVLDAGSGWWRELEGTTSLPRIVEAGLDIVAGVLGSILPSPFPMLSSTALPNWSVWLLGIFWILLGFLGLQMTVLFFFVRTAMPGRKLVFWSFLEVAFQRMLRILPVGVVIAVMLSSIAVFSGSWWMVSAGTGAVFVGLCVFCFAHPATAAFASKKARPIRRSLLCWQERPFAAIWFVFMLLLHGVLLGLLRGASVKMMDASPSGAIMAAYGLSFLRVLVVVWLAATWAVFFSRSFSSTKK